LIGWFDGTDELKLSAWLDGWMVGWLDGCMAGWLDGTDELKLSAWLDGWMDFVSIASDDKLIQQFSYIHIEGLSDLAYASTARE
jgi:organic anion transporter 5A